MSTYSCTCTCMSTVLPNSLVGVNASHTINSLATYTVMQHMIPTHLLIKLYHYYNVLGTCAEWCTWYTYMYLCRMMSSHMSWVSKYASVDYNGRQSAITCFCVCNWPRTPRSRSLLLRADIVTERLTRGAAQSWPAGVKVPRNCTGLASLVRISVEAFFG